MAHTDDLYDDDAPLKRLKRARASLRVLSHRLDRDAGVYAPYAVEARIILHELDRLDITEIERANAAASVELERYPRRRGAA